MQAGDDQLCPRCGSWHRLEQRNGDSGTDYAHLMLYVTCRGLVYFAGMVGKASRTPTRPAKA